MSPRHLLRFASGCALGASVVAAVAYQLADPFDLLRDFWAVWAICGTLAAVTLWLLSFTASEE
jgi:hypothetical protein